MYTKPFMAYFTEEASIVFECVEMQMQLSCVLKICVDLCRNSTQKAAFPTPTLSFSNEKVCKLKPFILRFMWAFNLPVKVLCIYRITPLEVVTLALPSLSRSLSPNRQFPRCWWLTSPVSQRLLIIRSTVGRPSHGWRYWFDTIWAEIADYSLE